MLLFSACSTTRPGWGWRTAPPWRQTCSTTKPHPDLHRPNRKWPSTATNPASSEDFRPGRRNLPHRHPRWHRFYSPSPLLGSSSQFLAAKNFRESMTSSTDAGMTSSRRKMRTNLKRDLKQVWNMLSTLVDPDFGWTCYRIGLNPRFTKCIILRILSWFDFC